MSLRQTPVFSSFIPVFAGAGRVRECKGEKAGGDKGGQRGFARASCGVGDGIGKGRAVWGLFEGPWRRASAPPAPLSP